MTPPDPQSKALAALVKHLGERPSPPPTPVPDPAMLEADEPLLAEFLRSFLVWESTSEEAEGALKRIARNVVDFNELRVCLPDELVRMLGRGYPRVQERALRLRAALNELFLREHAVTLQPVQNLAGREARGYLNSLEGVPAFVSARVGLLRLGMHCAPVDGRVLRRLVEAGVVAAGTPEAEAAEAIEKRLSAGELAPFCAQLQSWADELPLTEPQAEGGTAADAAPAGAPDKDAARKPLVRAAANGDAKGTTTGKARTPAPKAPRPPKPAGDEGADGTGKARKPRKR